jgi:hypothetical protein
MRYACQTLFDITATGITGHFKSVRLPQCDLTGQQITDQSDWNRSRNQQRNWETLTQIIGLRTQLFDITDPLADSTGTRWMFEFETETAGAFGPASDPCQVLLQDADGVPMLRDLNNGPDIEPFLCTTGTRQNIWFAPININNRP